LTYSEVLADIPDRAIQETANRYISGSVPGQNKTFCPSIAEFREAAERQVKLIEVRERPRLPAPAQPEHLRTELEPTKWRPRPADELARHVEQMAHFRRSMGIDPNAVEGPAHADLEAKYSKEALAGVPDNPNRSEVPGYERVGAAGHRVVRR